MPLSSKYGEGEGGGMKGRRRGKKEEALTFTTVNAFLFSIISPIRIEQASF